MMVMTMILMTMIMMAMVIMVILMILMILMIPMVHLSFHPDLNIVARHPDFPGHSGTTESDQKIQDDDFKHDHEHGRNDVYF